jgi:hypothetical protein
VEAVNPYIKRIHSMRIFEEDYETELFEVNNNEVAKQPKMDNSSTKGKGRG